MKIHKFNVLDEYNTPACAVEPLLQFIKPNSWIWCPFDKPDSNFVKALREAGHRVVNSHYDPITKKGIDFLTLTQPISKIDYIISNPPWSIKDKILTKLYEFNIPFAMLLPSYAIGGNKRYELFKDKELQLLIPKQRINYIKPNGYQTKGCAFHSSYFCYKILTKQIIFTELKE